jgi:2-iminoacetate synthase ThiH
MEESISKAAGANFGEYASPGELRALIRTIGRIPAERATTYGIRKVFDHPDAEEHLPVERLEIFSSGTNHAPVPATGY